MVDRYDETLEVVVAGEMIKYTLAFNRVKRSNYGLGCVEFEKVIEFRGEVCFIPPENECLRRCIEFINQKDYSQEYCDFKKDSVEGRNIMTLTRIQTFRKKNTA